MITRMIFLFLFLGLFFSCSHVYKEYDRDSFSSTYVWADGQQVKFNPTINDVNKIYSLTLALRHHYSLATPELNVHILIIAPSGKKTEKDFKLLLKDGDNKNIGSCAGDMCDLDSIVFNDFKFDEAGEYQVTILHTERGYSIPGILEVGLVIDEKEV